MDRPASGSHRKPRGKARPGASQATGVRKRPPRPKPLPPTHSSGAASERLQKVLAAAGLGSRRSCEQLILQGRVTVNGETIRELGTKVEPSAKIEVDGTSVKRERLVYLAVAKPKGYVSTTDDPAGRPRVVDLVAGAISERVYTVGRLDEDSTGLMILTNDGALANRLAHPRYGVEKVYRAVVAGRPERDVYDKLIEGVWLSDGKARARRVRVVRDQGDATVVEMVLSEGKNREVRRMWAKFGHKVMSLSRVAIGPISIKGLRPGQWRSLSPFEVGQLHQIAEGRPVATAWFSASDRATMAASRPRRGPARHEIPTAPTASRAPGRGVGSALPPSRRPKGRVPTGPAADRRPMQEASSAGPRPARPVSAAPAPGRGPARQPRPGLGTARPGSRGPQTSRTRPPRPRSGDPNELEVPPDLVGPAEGRDIQAPSPGGRRFAVPSGPRASRVVIGLGSPRPQARPRPPRRRPRPLPKPRRKPPEVS